MKLQSIKTTVAAAGNRVKLADDLDKDYSHLIGVALMTTAISPGSTINNATINSNDIKMIAKDMGADVISSTTDVAPNARFWSVMEMADGNKIEIEVTDGGNAAAYPYELEINLLLSNCECEHE